MGIHFQCSHMRYAVIGASSNKDRPERLVIAYQDEDCLRDLIAAPSMFGLGFSSREEAMASLKSLANVAPSKSSSRITAIFHATRESSELADVHGRPAQRRILPRILQSALAALIALFYSTNVLSVIIRMALGASF